MDAVGAALAMYAAYSSVIDKIGLAEIFFLTWIGPFLDELTASCCGDSSGRTQAIP